MAKVPFFQAGGSAIVRPLAPPSSRLGVDSEQRRHVSLAHDSPRPDPSSARIRRTPVMRKEALYGVVAVFGSIIGIGVLCMRGEAD